MKSSILVLFFAGVCAQAMPQYALKEHKDCVYCHYDARGGGPTNAAGRYYAQHYTLEGYREIQKKKKVRKKHHVAPAAPVPAPPSDGN